jgi:hypothetical protein
MILFPMFVVVDAGGYERVMERWRRRLHSPVPDKTGSSVSFS